MSLFMCNVGVIYIERDSSELKSSFSASIVRGQNQAIVIEQMLTPEVFSMQKSLDLVDGEDDFHFVISCKEILEDDFEEMRTSARTREDVEDEQVLMESIPGRLC